jgi:hypothetical protein
MPRPPRQILISLLLVFIVVAVASCSERACTVRANHAKWKHYNGLQYSGNKQARKK